MINGQENPKTVERLYRLTWFERLKNERSETVSQRSIRACTVSGRLGRDSREIPLALPLALPLSLNLAFTTS